MCLVSVHRKNMNEITFSRLIGPTLFGPYFQNSPLKWIICGWMRTEYDTLKKKIEAKLMNLKMIE